MSLIPGAHFKSRVIFHEGFIFHQNKFVPRTRTTYYTCRKRDCHATGVLKEGTAFRQTQAHNGHPACDEEDIKGHFLERLKEYAAKDTRPLKQIYTDVSQLPEFRDVAPHVGFGKVVSTLEKVRRRTMPNIPDNLSELAEMLNSPSGAHIAAIARDENSKFFLGNYESDGFEAIFFGDPELLSELDTQKQLHIDATFRCVPRKPKAYQLLSIHFRSGENIFPGIYVLMTKKTSKAYKIVLRMVKKLCPNMKPEVIITDYEKALRIALRKIFPRAVLVGCFFHYSQALWKNTQKLGLVKLFKKNQHAEKSITMVMALALLPAGEIVEGFEFIKSYARQHLVYNQLKNFFAYVQRFWINEEGVDSFSVHDRRHRTNNALESFHSALMRYIQVSHPNIYTFLEKLKKISAAAHTDLLTQRLGNEATRARKVKYLIRDVRINRASSRLERGVMTVPAFLEITCKMCYNPKRHSAAGRAPALARPTLTARRRGLPPPAAQQIDSDSV